VNMGDFVPCTVGVGGCPEDGRWQYNTDVVFSEQGKILAKYHKSHLYFEPEFDQPPVPEPQNFTTSFGVTFGIMICFDIMFPYPQLYYAQANITNLIYSTWWVNTPPYFSANQVQLAWSRDTGSNLLASGIGLNYYTSGSGIYTAGTPLEFYFNPTWNPSQKLLVHSLPKNPNTTNKEKEVEDKWKEVEEEVTGEEIEDEYISFMRLVGVQGIAGAKIGTFLASSGASGSLSVSDGNLTCSVTYLVSESAEDYYALAVLNGDYNGLFYAQICALLRCPSNSSSCTEPVMNASTVFEQFSLSGNFSTETRLYNTVTTNNMYLAPIATYESGPTFVKSTNFGLPLLCASIFGVVWG